MIAAAGKHVHGRSGRRPTAVRPNGNAEPLVFGRSGAGREVAPGLATEVFEARSKVRLVLALERRVDGIVDRTRACPVPGPIADRREVLAIHGGQVERYGGAQRLRDEGQLESACVHTPIGALFSTVPGNGRESGKPG